MSAPDLQPARCPHCQAEIYWSDASQCWMCGGALGRPGPAVEVPAPVPAAARRTFGLGSLMLVIALIAVVLGVFREVPGWGILLVLLATPALARTLATAAHRKARHRPMTAGEKVAAFFSSVGLILVIVLAVGVAFFATCWMGFMGGAAVSSLLQPDARDYRSVGWGLFAGVPLGLAVAILVGYRLIRWHWTRKD